MAALARRAGYRLARVEPLPTLLWLRHARQARQLGLDRLHCVLSFDCDTDEDADAVLPLDAWLSSLGVRATYAVPGAYLRRTPEVYRALRDRGREFIAHGERAHSARVDGRYVSTFDYDRADPATAADIANSKTAFREVLGSVPAGFRAPHFGAFQARADLALLHQALAEHGYRFSTSTTPAYGLRHGPVHRTASGVLELAVSGLRGAPLQILDSFGFIGRRTARPIDSYYAQFAGAIDFFVDRGLPGIINTYADPSQVHGSDDFRRVMEHLAARGVRCVTYEELLAAVGTQGPR